ncbi:MAG: hypothetical protein QME51_09940, partial [Planctomycetota bacterium]|nr:hypothetical protein [Planctomycetota bacterium]
NAEGETKTFINTALTELTGLSFDKQEEWEKWGLENYSSSFTLWLINGLDKTTDPQRLKTIQKLIRITGKDFSYPETATEEEKKAVIDKWKEFGKSIK